ncbi:hypothetical protein OD91_1569 [Lutibacter sp. Hel_I_33_5]|uniref:hypothetical protein n=1 Tax=Lutibacter sp. Hel_I_33_5 TaxID=1566289 RepID=UPI0011A8281C|nr:hypothetical protein [Lutibacter sp. Hel_I_33_5]TVZ56285.1 hypothetical protein OD91_1569 [Lutibacter sp. Hel_I_33_5]
MKNKILMLLFFISIVTFAQQKKVFIEVTFNDGDFKGTHKFYPEKGNFVSQINLELFEGVSNLNASKLVAENGMQIHYINRHFLGEANKGSYKAKKHTSGCGALNFLDFKNEKPYRRINGNFSGCTNTKITSTTPWKKRTIKDRRFVTGSFTDEVAFEYVMDDGSKKNIKTTVSVKFLARESRRK